MGRGTTGQSTKRGAHGVRRARGAAAGALPIRNYDEMTVGEIRSEIQDLPAGDIRKLQTYEEKHKGRQTLLRAFEERRSTRSRSGGGTTRSTAPSRERTATARGTSPAGRGTSRAGSTGRERTAGSRGSTGGRTSGGGSGASKRTTNHDTIRRWIEQRGGVPVSVRGTARGDNAGVLRIDFEGYGAGSDKLREISWDEFFEKFDDKHLEFLYQDRTRGGNESRFFKFVSREGNASRRG